MRDDEKRERQADHDRATTRQTATTFVAGAASANASTSSEVRVLEIHRHLVDPNLTPGGGIALFAAAVSEEWTKLRPSVPAPVTTVEES